MLDNVTIVIRSSGERTEELCKEFILAQSVEPSNVFIVKETPFSVSMRKSFKIGIENALFWTFCIDADVLLRYDAVYEMLRLAEKKEEKVCEIQGLVLDKFFGGPRDAGNHLYRTSLLDKLITKIPAEGEDIRPEYHVLQKMKSEGYSWLTVPCLLGLHDFEQYYRDIFRKCFVQAHKHMHHTDLFLSLWRNNATKDKDYWVALQGFAAGVKYNGDVRINVTQEIYKQEYRSLNVDEKNPISRNMLFINDIENIISDWKEPEIYNNKFPTKLGLTPPKSIKEQFINRFNILGLPKMIPYSIGCLLNCIGDKLKMSCTRKD